MILVETAGNFQLMDPMTGAVIRHEGYTCVPNSSFIGQRIALNQAHVVAEVNNDATDADWRDTVEQSKGDIELAIAAFVAEFPVQGKTEEAAKLKAEADEAAEAARLKAEADEAARLKAEAETKAKAEAEAKGRGKLSLPKG
ncbi:MULTISPECIES: hypothetical protein [unclassified Beijerinckia]|uniref:hypothetical protein n=1 Tax=unclassified Beijerinckia TaxID=2638183 RepID=UPI000896B096|nr:MULTISPECIES: hypothetical protein [unclassified Beijerinckia]MDH7796426.1 membrane protein involved in colicin uptake [Beijerinckia sp. GAS462]SEC44586.1 hypothetical protein SAMN05443249_2708 [Beijerinckia sp. 28-YEA-48]